MSTLRNEFEEIKPQVWEAIRDAIDYIPIGIEVFDIRELYTDNYNFIVTIAIEWKYDNRREYGNEIYEDCTGEIKKIEILFITAHDETGGFVDLPNTWIEELNND